MKTKVLLRIALGFCLGIAPITGASPEEEYLKDIRPLLEQKCFDCHGPDKQKGDLNLSIYSDYDAVVHAPEVWKLVFERVQAFEMPPEKAPELDFGQQRRLVKWLRELPKPETNCQELASDRTASFYRGYVMSRRLNRAEYNNTVRDLVGIELKLEEFLPADGGGGEGFDTAGNALFTSPIHIERYMNAADHVLETVLPDAEQGMSPEIAKARQRILIAQPNEEVAPREAARQIVASFARRAFRRPVTDDEVDRLLTMFDRGWERGDGFIPSLRLALKAVLISPNFLFLAEPEPEEGGVHPLGSVPLASKLSYFLWSSMPDEELLSLAEQDGLSQTNVLKQQIHRMLADPKASQLGEQFAMQWLDLHRLGDEIHPDPAQYPEFDLALSEAMRREVVDFFNFIIRENRSLLELIDAEYTFANQRLAELYGIDGVTGGEFQQVKLENPNRGGLVGMAAVSALTSYPFRTSPVLRGRWILEVLLGDEVPPPPPDVPALDEAKEKDEKLSLREQLELHRSKPDCAACHQKMDPLGFGMENFDVLGRWRDIDRGHPINAMGTLPSGETFTGPSGLKDVLMARKDKVLRHLVRKMTGYAFGRELNKFDECVIDHTMEALEKNEYRAAVMIEQIALSFPFRHRFYPKHD